MFNNKKRNEDKDIRNNDNTLKVVYNKGVEKHKLSSQLQDLFNNWALSRGYNAKTFSTSSERTIGKSSDDVMLGVYSQFKNWARNYIIFDENGDGVPVVTGSSQEIVNNYPAYTFDYYHTKGRKTTESINRDRANYAKKYCRGYANFLFEKKKGNFFDRKPNLAEYLKVLKQMFPTWDSEFLIHNTLVFTRFIESLYWNIGYKEADYYAGWIILQSVQSGGNGKSLLQSALAKVLWDKDIPYERFSLTLQWGNIEFAENIVCIVDDISLKQSRNNTIDELIKKTADLKSGDSYSCNMKFGDVKSYTPRSINIAATNSEFNFPNASKFNVIHYCNSVDLRIKENEFLKKKYCVSESEYAGLLLKAIELCPFGLVINDNKERSAPTFVLKFKDLITTLMSRERGYLGGRTTLFDINKGHSWLGIKKIMMNDLGFNENQIDEWRPIVHNAINWLTQHTDEEGKALAQPYKKDGQGGWICFFQNPEKWGTLHPDTDITNEPDIRNKSLAEIEMADTCSAWNRLIARAEAEQWKVK